MLKIPKQDIKGKYESGLSPGLLRMSAVAFIDEIMDKDEISQENSVSPSSVVDYSENFGNTE